jgi:hypothetical protein
MHGRDATTLPIRDAKAPLVATDSDERRQVRALLRRAVDRMAARARAKRLPVYARSHAQAIASSHPRSNDVDQGQRPDGGIA